MHARAQSRINGLRGSRQRCGSDVPASITELSLLSAEVAHDRLLSGGKQQLVVIGCAADGESSLSPP
jgi:hypothetical protein